MRFIMMIVVTGLFLDNLRRQNKTQRNRRRP